MAVPAIPGSMAALLMLSLAPGFLLVLGAEVAPSLKLDHDPWPVPNQTKSDRAALHNTLWPPRPG
jgi:hypothetical protein